MILEAYWIQIQSAEIEVDCICKPLLVTESAAADFDRFDSTVDAFRWSITDFENDCIENSPEVFSDRLGNFNHGVKPTT